MTGNELLDAARRAYRRLVRSDFQEIHATEHEQKLLAAAERPVTEPLAQKFAVWRRSLLWIGGAALVLLAVLEAITFVSMSEMLGDSEITRAAGQENLETVDGVFGFLIVPVLIGGALALAAAALWTNVQASRRMARIGYLIMFLTPFAMAALPVQSLLELDHLQENAKPVVALGLGTVVGLRLFILIGPRAIALFPGVIRSSMALKTLVPQSPMPGWATTFVAPLYAIFLLVVFALINQIQGNFLLVAGLVCLMISPLVYLWRRKEILRPHTVEEVSAVVGSLRKQAGLITLVGILFFGIFFIDIEMSFGDIVKFIVSIVGNVVLLTVVGADFLLALIHHGHDQSKALVESAMDAELEERFESLAGVAFTDSSAKP